MKTFGTCLACSASLLAASCASFAQPAAPNYDEAKIPAYTLPDPLKCRDGTAVTTSAQWLTKRRAELLGLFAEHVYGRSPAPPAGQKVELTSLATNALGGLATRKEYTVWFTGQTNGPSLNLLLYVPNAAKQPVPAFLGLNFNGNHAISTDPGIRLADRWLANAKDGSVTNNRATAAARGNEASRWQVERILGRGYAVATVYCGDLEPDFAQGWKSGVRAARSPAGTNTVLKPDDWGAIGAWAWGLSRALDALQSESAVDAKHIAVIGHSRLGKTALWAGAQDERFAMVISNESGEGGAALARRPIGETTAIIQKSFPHWFCGNFKQYADNESALPVDQHELLALVAPRPLYVASAEGDRWADPRGEFLAAKGAEPVYALFGKAGLGVAEMPGTNQPAGDFIRYHIRAGKHDVTEYDWEQYLAFADRHLKR
jgi:hypothetical protein